MRPTQDTEVCTHCGDRGCPRRFTASSQPAPIAWIVACMQRQLAKQSQELWRLRRDVARLLAKEDTPTVETVSEFKARVQRVRERYPQWLEGTAVWNAMGSHFMASDVLGSPEQAVWARRIAGGDDDPFHDNRRIPAFIAAAVKAGVLRADP